MRVFDTTTFFEEKLMMDLRFNILDPFVDKFIVCEATFSHSGKKKEIKFDKKDFPKFEDKIVPRPKYWVGIKIVPVEFEFWEGGEFRIHKREVFFLKKKS